VETVAGTLKLAGDARSTEMEVARSGSFNSRTAIPRRA
jgi:hypothetical protein